jgi:hypothetical protein
VTATALALVIVVGSPARTRAADLHGVTGFDEYAENHDDIAKALGRHPSLARDPSYLLHHPSLAHFLHDNPTARAELEGEDDDVEAVVQQEDEHHREETVKRGHLTHPDPLRRLDSANPDGD